MNKFKKNIKGITLIALVVTILVLLILVGVAISLSIGNNGLFSRAKKAVTVNKSSTIVERLELALGEYQTVRPFLSTEEEQKNELEKILKNIEGIEEVRYDEETKKFTVIIENETFLVDLDGSYERKNMTINITKEKTGEGVKIKVKVTSKQEIESIVISKDGNSNTLDINKKNEEYTTEKIVEEEGIYQVNVRTETGEEEIVNIDQKNIRHDKK